MTPTIPKKELPAIIKRIQEGSSLGKEAKQLGFSYRNPLIEALRAFMGREKYDALIAGRRPGARKAAPKEKKEPKPRVGPPKKKKRVIAPDVLQGIVDRLHGGGSNLLKEAQALGMTHRTTLIGALREFMGREQYDALMHAKKAEHRKVLAHIDRPRPDDAGLTVVESMRRSDGWSCRYVTEHPPRVLKIPKWDGKKADGYFEQLDGGERILIMRSPEGFEYVEAQDTEKADLLRVHPVFPEHGARMRFVLWESSKMKQKVDKAWATEEELVERGRAAKERKKEKENATPEDVQAQQAKELKRISKNSTKAKAKRSA